MLGRDNVKTNKYNCQMECTCVYEGGRVTKHTVVKKPSLRIIWGKSGVMKLYIIGMTRKANEKEITML